MVDDAQVGVRVVLIRLHNLRSCIAHCRGLPARPLQARSYQTITLDDASSLLLLGTLLEEYLAKDVFLLTKGIVILHIVVMWLVKHAVGVVITIGVLVSYPSDLT